MTRFSFVIMAPKISSSTKAIIMVLSKNTEEKVREEIRQSWGSKSNPHLKVSLSLLVFFEAKGFRMAQPD